MKKLLNVTALLLVAAVMFAGCSSPSSSSDPNSPSTPTSGGHDILTDEGILFDNTLATDTFTPPLQLSDGNWISTYKSVTNNTALLEKIEFTISGSGTNIQCTSKTNTYYNNTTKEIYETKITSESDLADLSGLTATSTDYIFLKYTINTLETHKSNSDHTKYYATGILTTSEGNQIIQLPTTIYIMKKE